MGSVNDKLNKILDTKEKIKNAIIEKGVQVEDEAFSLYPDKIKEIENNPEGGGAGK